MRLGTSYYPEHWPEARWAGEARHMRALGLRVVRMAEFSWARLEPEPGRLDLGWLERAVGVMADAGLEVMLGTPTATPPAWLTAAEPEILVVDAEGRRRRHGGRRHACPSNASFQAHATRIVEALGGRFGTDPRVVAWQIDNEFGGSGSARCHCEASAEAFRAWLRTRYGTLEALNEAWGTMVWSQAYSDWAQVGPPILQLNDPNPGLALDFRRFSTDAHAALARLQARILARLAPRRPTFTNFMGPFPGLDPFVLAAAVDVAGWDSYPTGNVERWTGTFYGDEPVLAGGRPFAHDAGDPDLTGFAHELTRSLRDAPFWVTEQQAGHINWGRQNPQPRPGTVRLWTWHAALAGADTVLYYHWQAAVMGQEQYHSGLLRHDGEPGAGYDDVARVAREADELGAVAAARPEAAVAILVSWDDLWALELQPHRAGFGALRLAFAWYRACLRLGVDVDLVPADPGTRRAVPRRPLADYAVIVAPTAHVADGRLADDLADAAAAGAHVILGVRSGFKGPTSLVTTDPLPGPFRALSGVTLTSWQGLPPGVAYGLERADGASGASDGGIPDGARTPLEGTVWAEALDPGAGTLVALRWVDGPLAGRAAVTVRSHGPGTVRYVGAHPSVDLALEVLDPVLSAAGVDRLAAPGTRLPEGVVAVRRAGRVYVLGFAEAPVEVTIGGRTATVGCREVVVLEDARREGS